MHDHPECDDHSTARGGFHGQQPVLLAFVSVIYSLDNTISATVVRNEMTAMIADNSRVY